MPQTPCRSGNLLFLTVLPRCSSKHSLTSIGASGSERSVDAKSLGPVGIQILRGWPPRYPRTIPSGSPHSSQDCNEPSLNFALSRVTGFAIISKRSQRLESGPPRHKSCGGGVGWRYEQRSLTNSGHSLSRSCRAEQVTRGEADTTTECRWRE